MKYSPTEILHYCLRWIFNFREGDLQEAHKNYSSGSDYHWNKYLALHEADMNPTQAMTDIVLNMDDEGKDLLINWVMDKSKVEIKDNRWLKKATKKHLERESINEDQN